MIAGRKRGRRLLCVSVESKSGEGSAEDCWLKTREPESNRQMSSMVLFLMVVFQNQEDGEI
jgi:hypothetical protein